VYEGTVFGCQAGFVTESEGVIPSVLPCETRLKALQEGQPFWHLNVSFQCVMLLKNEAEGDMVN